VEVLRGNIGYLNLTAFWRSNEGAEVLSNAMRLLSRADALIIDMRENLGGSPDTVIVLASHLLAPDVPLFEIVPRSGSPTQFRTTKIESADDKRRVYVLVSRRTFSAGEGFAFLMQERQRATVVGETTAGAANPGGSHRVNDTFDVTIPNGLVRGAVTGGNWEGTGVTPDVAAKASDALRVAHDHARRIR
jgi:C-terminal processing protease CtpA/Prc